MSRTLEFRVWDIPNQCWSDLFHVITEDGALWHFPNIGLDERDDPEQYTVEQYTGLTDKNGKGIYEGDIVKANYFESHYAALDVGKTKQITGRIQFGNGCFYASSMSDETPLFQSGGSNNIEVVGNVHENPELLGGEDA